jgi:hypothetical protein
MTTRGGGRTRQTGEGSRKRMTTREGNREVN